MKGAKREILREKRGEKREMNERSRKRERQKMQTETEETER